MHFVLDISGFSSIIYILYEGGGLRPPLARPRFRFPPEQPQLKEEEWRRKAAERKRAVRSGKTTVPPVPGVIRNDTPFFYALFGRLNPVPYAHSPNPIPLLEVIHDVHAGHDMPEHGVPGIEVRMR